MEKNLEAVAAGYRAMRSGYEAGIRSVELFEKFRAALTNALGRYELKYDYLIGADTLKIDGESADRVLCAGDVILMDVSVGVAGVWCDVCRTFFVGGVTDKQREVFELVKRSLRSGEKALRNGATAEEIYAATNEIYLQTGKELVHHAGHRIGKAALLPPRFLHGNNERIRVGDFVTVETGLYDEVGGIRLENDYRVTDSGAEDLFEALMPLNIEEYILA